MSSRRPWEVNRRALLGGAGATLGLPMLEAMVPGVRGARAAGTPKRFLVYVFTYGTPDIYNALGGSFHPRENGSDYALTDLLQPLAAFKKKMTVVSGLDNSIGQDTATKQEELRLGDHWAATLSLLTGVHVTKGNATCDGCITDASISVDQVVANAFKNDTPSLPSMFMNSMYQAEFGESVCWLSWTGPRTPKKQIISSTEAFTQIFGAPGSDPATIKRRLKYKASVLHRAQADAARLRNKLGSTDRETLDQYLTGVETLERRVAGTKVEESGAMCVTGKAPTTTGAETGPVRLARTLEMIDLIPLAFQCDKTRVILFAPGHEHNFTMPWLGEPWGSKVWHNQCSHWFTFDRENASVQQENLEAYRRGTLWHMEQLASILKKLDETKENDGSGMSLLDNTLVLCTSELQHGDGHPVAEVPVIVAGGGGGSAIRLGQHVTSRGGIANLYVTLLNALGISTDKFGDSTGTVSLG